MVDDAAREFAANVWNRVLRDVAFVAAASGDLLVCVVGDEGLEATWLERASAELPRDSGGQHDERQLNVRKRLSKRIAQSNATSAAAASWATYRSTLIGRVEWLVVIATDARGDAGYVARVGRDPSGMRIVGPRTDWPARRQAPFEDPDITQVLDPARAAMLHMLSQGLRDATKQRRREARRR
jgi:hypothetical protein